MLLCVICYGFNIIIIIFKSYKCDVHRAEYGAFWKYVQTGFLYLFVQFCKMLLLATFFPAFDDSKFDVFVVIIIS